MGAAALPEPGRRNVIRLGGPLSRAGLRLIRRLGYTVVPYGAGPVAGLLAQHRVTLLLDVGANAGQFAQRVRGAGFRGRMVSFEPLSAAFSALEQATQGDPSWQARRLALGDSDGEATINVAGNSWSSSLLPIGERHVASAPESRYVGAETVPTARLDTIWDEIAQPADVTFIKLDVQGFEMHVLRGAGDSLARVEGVQVELSFVSLYDGDAPWREVVDHLQGAGFELAGLEAGYADRVTGLMVQADALFARPQRPTARSTASTSN